MKFKTTIEIITDAENAKESFEIVEDYLSGNLTSGVDMKCSTRSIPNYNKNIVYVTALSLILAVVTICGSTIKISRNHAQNLSGVGAIQPPLKTDKKDISFKKEWQAKQTTEALNLIKR